jgi:SulP family sulfate permease
MTSQSVSLRRQLTQVFDNPERLPRLLAYMEKVSLPKGLALFHQGDEADALYFVESGKLTVTLHLPRNRTKRLATIGPGAIVGEIGLFLNRPRSASVLTEQSVVLYKLTHASFLELQVKEPELALAFQQAVIGLLSRRLMQANKELDILLK